MGRRCCRRRCECCCRGRSVRRRYGCCRGRSFIEAEDLKNLVGPYLVGHTAVLSVPTSAARAVAVARVLPCSAGVRLNRAVVPEPLPVWIEILHGLHRNPVRPRRREYAHRRPADLKVRRSSRVRPVEERGNSCTGQVARAICVKINVERRRRSAPCGILAHHAHSSNVQEDRWGGTFTTKSSAAWSSNAAIAGSNFCEPMPRGGCVAGLLY
jgi:hypothetical protein